MIGQNPLVNENISPLNVEDMTFELPRPQPIRGFPELNWAGKRPFTSTHYFPAQKKESYGDPVDGWMNRIYWGDNLQVMSHLLKEFRSKVDLVYIDPPFDSKAEYKKTITIKGMVGQSEISNFEEKQYSDIWTNDEYLQFLYERVILAKELLNENGIFCLHCDFHKSQVMRCILDEIFGTKNFINDVIWYYENKPQFGFMKHLPHDHDYIFIYSKNKSNIHINHQQIPVKEVQQQAVVAWDPILKKRVAKKDEFGNIIYEKREQKYMGSVWTLPLVHPIGKERTGYPTQKPEILLERLLKIFGSPGSIVLDCFMGSGTTQAVAMKLGRRFIGADINMGAIQTTTKRLNGIISERKKSREYLVEGDPLYLNFEVYNVNNYDVFRNPAQAKDLLIQALEIERLDNSEIFDGMKDGYKVKIMPVNRIATRKDLNPIISGMNYRELNNQLEKSPSSVLDKIMLVCMGHEPDLAAHLKMEIGTQYNIDVKVVDILREKDRGLTFKYDSEADIVIEGDELVIRQFYPRNLLQKLSMLEENVEEWRELAESVAIDWNYTGEVLRPAVFDCPGKNELVQGRYKLPPDYGIIRVKITDLLSESLELTIDAETE